MQSPAVKCPECGAWMELSEADTKGFYCSSCGYTTAGEAHDLLWQDMIDKLESGIYQVPQSFIDASEKLVRRDKLAEQTVQALNKKPN